MTDFKRFLYTCCAVFLPTLVFYSWYVYLSSKAYLDKDIITATVLFATLLAIIVYTWKTWQLKDLTSGELSYRTRPLVVLNIRKGPTSSREEENHGYLVDAVGEVKNIGEGLATDIEIQPIEIIRDKVKICVRQKVALGMSDKEELTFYFDRPVGLDLINDYSNRLIKALGDNKDIKIYYKDFQGRGYYTLMRRKEYGRGWSFYETGTGHK